MQPLSGLTTISFMTNQNYEQHFFKENVNSNYSENVTEISFQTLFIYFVDKNVFII